MKPGTELPASDLPLADAHAVCTFAYLDEQERPQRGTFFSTQAGEEVLSNPGRLKRAVQQLCADMGWTFLQIQGVVQRHHTVKRTPFGTRGVARRAMKHSRDAENG